MQSHIPSPGLLPGLPLSWKCQGIFRATGITEPDKVLSANSSCSINILSLVLVLLLFIDCTNCIHRLLKSFIHAV